MHSKDYRRALLAAKRELEDLWKQREQIDQRIAKLKTVFSDLAALCNAPVDDRFSPIATPKNAQSLGFTEAVRLALKTSPQPLTPPEVARRLREWRIDLDKYANPLASIHITLKRLAKNGEVEPVQVEGGKKAYRWVTQVARVLASLQDVDRGLGFKD